MLAFAQCQGLLPYPPIKLETFENNSFILPQFEGLPELSTFYLSRCTTTESLKENLLQDIDNFAEIVDSDIFPSSFHVCGWFENYPHGNSFGTRYLFAVFGTEQQQQSFMLKGEVWGVGGGGNALPRTDKHNLEITTKDWLKVSPNVYSFVREVLDLESSQTDGKDDYSEANSFKRYFNLIEIIDGGVKQRIYNLPLASYVWSHEDETPIFTNQLTVSLDFPNTIQIGQAREVISNEQQSWLGLYALE